MDRRATTDVTLTMISGNLKTKMRIQVQHFIRCILPADDTANDSSFGDHDIVIIPAWAAAILASLGIILAAPISLLSYMITIAIVA